MQSAIVTKLLLSVASDDKLVKGSRQGHSLVNSASLPCPLPSALGLGPRLDPQHHMKPSVAVHTWNFSAWEVEASRLVRGYLHSLNKFEISPGCLTLCLKSVCKRTWASAHTRFPPRTASGDGGWVMWREDISTTRMQP